MKAVDLFDLLDWTYRRQRVLEMSGVALFDVEAAADGRPLMGRSACGCVVAERNAVIGTAIDGGGVLRGVSGRVHPDAETVHTAVSRLLPGERTLVIDHARAGVPPDHLDPHRVRLVCVPVPPDQPGAVRHKVSGAWEFQPYAAVQAMRRRYGVVDGRGAGKFPAAEKGFRYRVPAETTAHASDREVLRRWCPLQPSPSPGQIAQVNGRYAAWHDAMGHLLDLLRTAPLKDHRVTGFRAPAQPWRDPAPLSPALALAIASVRELPPCA